MISCDLDRICTLPGTIFITRHTSLRQITKHVDRRIELGYNHLELVRQTIPNKYAMCPFPLRYLFYSYLQHRLRERCPITRARSMVMGRTVIGFAPLQLLAVQQATSSRTGPAMIACSLQFLEHDLSTNVVPGNCKRVFWQLLAFGVVDEHVALGSVPS